MSGFARKIAATVTVLLIGLGAAALPAAAAPSHTQITGSGSSWSALAVQQWIADVNKQGLQVVFTSTGSAQGRRDWAFKTTDFGVSDIGYQGRDPVTQQEDTSLGRKFAYLPIVAGGTSFPYNLSFAGRRIRNLRLSGPTIAKIFTNQIKFWDDKAVKADNNNKILLPHIPVIPVVHSEGSGSTYQFTSYLSKQYGSIWGAYAGQNSPTEYFPRKGNQQAQSGSDGVMNFITSSAGAGAIGFDEYSYALGANFPVAKVLNKAGYYTAPTQYNVAVALQQAIIDNDKSSPNYLTQDLKNVYTSPQIQAYPLSSYSYMIIPTAGSADPKTPQAAQRQTISDFLYYSICQGQAEMGPIGYSPLPVNLVQAGFSQIAKLQDSKDPIDITNRNVSTCNNPTFTAGNLKVNHLAKIAPAPPACDKSGAGPCVEGAGVVNANPGSDGSAPVNGNRGGSVSTGGRSGGTTTTGGRTGGGGAAGAAGGTGATVPGAGAGSTAAAKIDPATGQLVTSGSGTTDGTGAQDLVGQPTTLAAAQSTGGLGAVLYVLIIALLLILLAGPVLLSRLLARRNEASQ